MPAAFETDENGQIITRPLMGWTAAIAAQSAMVLRLNYAETSSDLVTGGKHLQLILTPPQCLELAELLKKHGEHLLAQRPSSPVN